MGKIKSYFLLDFACLIKSILKKKQRFQTFCAKLRTISDNDIVD
jgi:hypothetical protein